MYARRTQQLKQCNREKKKKKAQQQLTAANEKKKKDEECVLKNYVFFQWPIFTTELKRFTWNSLSTLTNPLIITFNHEFNEKYARILNRKSKITNFFFDSLLFSKAFTHTTAGNTLKLAAVRI